MERFKREYVRVHALFHPGGVVTPLRLTLPSGDSYRIDKVLDVRPAAARKAGGQGDRYTVRICGKETYLFFERSTELTGTNLGSWFVELKQP